MDDQIIVPGEWQNVDVTKEPPKGFFNNFSTHIIDFIQTLVVFGAIFALIYWQIAQPHRVSGNSMFPNFHNSDLIITDKLSYKFGDPQKGDIVVFENPRNNADHFIKRVIALPGDSIKVESEKVFVNGQLVEEVYLPDFVPTLPKGFLTEGVPIKAGDNQYYVFGDNREHSSDSREWGPIGKEKIIGKAFIRYWPIKGAGILKTCCPINF